MSLRPLEILLVEDNRSDARLTMEAFREGGVRNRLTVVNDGAEALALLRREGDHTSARRPDILLLDLNMPKKDGRELLSEIKRDPGLRQIPVVVLTTSQSEQDVVRSYDDHANCYISKPADLGRFVEAVKAIHEFWLMTAKIPRRQDS